MVADLLRLVEDEHRALRATLLLQQPLQVDRTSEPRGPSTDDADVDGELFAFGVGVVVGDEARLHW